MKTYEIVMKDIIVDTETKQRCVTHNCFLFNAENEASARLAFPRVGHEQIESIKEVIKKEKKK